MNKQEIKANIVMTHGLGKAPGNFSGMASTVKELTFRPTHIYAAPSENDDYPTTVKCYTNKLSEFENKQSFDQAEEIVGKVLTSDNWRKMVETFPVCMLIITSNLANQDPPAPSMKMHLTAIRPDGTVEIIVYPTLIRPNFDSTLGPNIFSKDPSIFE